MKVKKQAFLGLFVTMLSLFGSAASCNPVDDERQQIDADPVYAAKTFLRDQYMNVYYYWRDEVIDRNAAYKPYDYDIYDFFEAMLYKDDRWSWMCDKDHYISDETGVMTGTWGVSMGQAYEYYNDYNLRVRYIWPGSPFERFGVTRGAWLTHIDGVSLAEDETGLTNAKLKVFQDNFYKSPQTFTFRLADGRDTTFTASMASALSTRSSLAVEIFRPGDYPGLTEPVGYADGVVRQLRAVPALRRALKLQHLDLRRVVVLGERPAAARRRAPRKDNSRAKRNHRRKTSRECPCCHSLASFRRSRTPSCAAPLAYSFLRKPRMERSRASTDSHSLNCTRARLRFCSGCVVLK